MIKKIIIGFSFVTGIAAMQLSGCTRFDNSIHSDKLPISQKLVDITDDHVESILIWPKAEIWSFQFFIGIPAGNSINLSNPPPCPEFQGQITITTTHGDLVGKFHIDSGNVQPCNWLTHKNNLDGFILCRPNADKTLDSCKGGEKYKIRLDFTKRPDELKSLWVSYLQSQN